MGVCGGWSPRLSERMAGHKTTARVLGAWNPERVGLGWPLPLVPGAAARLGR
jgi:hypothetical protein